MKRAAMASLLVAAIAARPTPARAGAGEQSLSIEPGAGRLAQGETSLYGGSLGLSYEYRLGDRFSVRASGAVGVYHDTSMAYSGHATLGIVYVFDVLKYVPYASAGIGGLAAFGEDIDDGVDPVAELGGGLEVLHSRSFSYGAFARYESLFQQTSYITGGLRATWRWGFF